MKLSHDRLNKKHLKIALVYLRHCVVVLVIVNLVQQVVTIGIVVFPLFVKKHQNVGTFHVLNQRDDPESSNDLLVKVLLLICFW